jgi:hypothetical protein
MPTEARWIHGNAIVAETLHPRLVQVRDEGGNLLTYTDIVGRRRGFGLTYQGVNEENSFNWFHAMIPTPAVLAGTRTRLERVFVLYETSNPVFVREIHVWDGQNFIQAFNVGGAGHGPFGSTLKLGATQFEIDEDKKPQVSFGIGISIHVEFGGDASSREEAATIRFTSAGAEFSYSWVASLLPRVGHMWSDLYGRFFGG